MSNNNNTKITGANILQKKRFANELKFFNNQPLGYITAYPDDKNPLIWYFLVVGQKGTQYYGGHYIGEIHHSEKYPVEPPNYYMRTPSGRYEINNKICLSNSSYHRGEWSPTWNIQSILIAFYSIWLDDTEHGISHIKRTPQEREKMAKESMEYNIKNYKKIYEKFDFTTLTDDIDNDPKFKKEVKKEEPKIEEIKIEKPKIEEIKIEEVKIEEIKIEEVKIEKPKIEEVIIEEPKVESKIEEVKKEKPKKEDVKKAKMIKPLVDAKPNPVFSEKIGNTLNEINNNINNINKIIMDKEEEIQKIINNTK